MPDHILILILFGLVAWGLLFLTNIFVLNWFVFPIKQFCSEIDIVWLIVCILIEYALLLADQYQDLKFLPRLVIWKLLKNYWKITKVTVCEKIYIYAPWVRENHFVISLYSLYIYIYALFCRNIFER